MNQRPGGMHSDLARRDQRAIEDLARRQALVRARVRQLAPLPVGATLTEVVQFLNALKLALESDA